MVKNRDQALGIDELSQGEPAYFIEESEKETYLKHIDQSVTFKIALHEVFGHGTSNQKSAQMSTILTLRHHLSIRSLGTQLLLGTRLEKEQVQFLVIWI